MNLWMIGAVIVGMLAIAGVFVVSTGTVNASEEKEITTCSTCGNSCTAENNCGLSTCGAVSGGSCGCGG